MQKLVPTATPVMVTSPAEVTEHPTLPAPNANVIAPVLLVVEYVAMLKGALPNVCGGRVDRSNVNVGVAWAMLNDCEIGPADK